MKKNSFREMLRRNYNSRRYWIDIELRHLSDYDDNLCDHLKKQPAELLPLVRERERNWRWKGIYWLDLVWRSRQGSCGWNNSSTSGRWSWYAWYSNHVNERCSSITSSTFKSSFSPFRNLSLIVDRMSLVGICFQIGQNCGYCHCSE